MPDEIKIIGSWEFAEITNAFEEKLKVLGDDFEVAIDNNEIESLPDFIRAAKDLIKEHQETAGDLGQYGSGIKKTKFLQRYEDELDYLHEQIEQAESKLKRTNQNGLD